MPHFSGSWSGFGTLSPRAHSELTNSAPGWSWQAPSATHSPPGKVRKRKAADNRGWHTESRGRPQGLTEDWITGRHWSQQGCWLQIRFLIRTAAFKSCLWHGISLCCSQQLYPRTQRTGDEEETVIKNSTQMWKSPTKTTWEGIALGLCDLQPATGKNFYDSCY